MRKIIYIILLIMCCLNAGAQADRQHIRSGNRLYRQQKFDKAEVEYRKAVAANKENPQALYNLGCSLLQQQKDSDAVEMFQAAAKYQTSKIRKSQIYHNIGVICQQRQMFQEAIDAYKESLRNNPKDDETRYNLALCQRQLKKQNKNDKDKQNNQDNKKDQNKKDQDKDQNQKNEDQNKKDQQDKQKQQPKEQMNKDNAEQLLQAAEQAEKNTQQKLKKQQGATRKRLEKNW